MSGFETAQPPSYSLMTNRRLGLWIEPRAAHEGEAQTPCERGSARLRPLLPQEARYGLRAPVDLTRAGGGQVTSGELAARTGVRRKVLEAILLELARNKVVVSRRGKFGGYLLARPPAETGFAEVIRVMDGPWRWRPASAGSPPASADRPDRATCSLREALLRARDATSDVPEGYSLAEAAACEGAEEFKPA